MKKKLAILGCGLAGATCARWLDKGKYDVTVYEKQDHVGGLCSTVRTEALQYDLGGHILFSRDPNVLEEMLSFLGDNVRQYVRNNKVLHRGDLIKYPFENGLRDMTDKRLAAECLRDYLFRDHGINPWNFEQHLLSHYGEKLCEEYLYPYNRKMWKCDLKELGTDWCDRLPREDDLDVLQAALSGTVEGYRHQAVFWYPCEGGIQALPESIFPWDEVDLKLNKDITELAGIPTPDLIISTIPLLKMVEMMPAEFDEALELKYLSVDIEPHTDPWDWPQTVFAVYTGDERYKWHRVCNYEFVNGHGWATETSSLPRIEATVRFAYPLHTPRRPAAVAKLREYLKAHNIYITGRFGEWSYNNMDKVYARAKRLALELNGL